MRVELELKLLELTKGGRRVEFRELAEHVHVELGILTDKIANLREMGLVSAQGTVGLDTGQRVVLADQLIRNGRDPQKVSRFLEWQEFEDFAARTLKENGFRTVKHLVFKTRAGRREIDLLAWNDTLLLTLDCKHWLRGFSPSKAQEAVQAQIERAVALADRRDLLAKHGVGHLEQRTIMPVIFALGDPLLSIVDGVPVVAVSKFISFLAGVSPLDERFLVVPVKVHTQQSVLG